MNGNYTVGIKLTGENKELVGVAQGSAAAIDKLRVTTSGAATEAEKLNLQQKVLAKTLNDQTKGAHLLKDSWQAQASAMSVASSEVQKILAKYDPLGAKLRSLQSDFATLNAAAKSGALGAPLDSAVDKSYKALADEIARTKGLMAAAGVATEGNAGSMAKLGLNSQYARRELMMLGREAVTGDFSQMPRTFGSLISHSNILPALLNPVAAVVVAIGAAAGVMAVAFGKGRAEMHEMNNALAMTSGFAGLTRGTMRELAQSVSDAGTLTIGTSKEIVTQLVATGRLGAQSIGAVAKLAEDYAAATGRDIDKIAPDLVKLFEDPAKGAAELNKQMHSMGPAFLEHLRHLTAIGNVEEARLLLAEKATAQIPRQIDQLGLLGKAWNSVKTAASSAWDAMLSVGRETTLEEKLADAAKNLNAQLNLRRPNPATAAAAQRYFDEQIDAVRRSQEAARQRQSTAETIDRRNAAAALVQQTSEYQRIKELREKIVIAGQMEVVTAEDQLNKTRAIHDLNKQIEGIYSSMGAEARALYEGRMAGELALYDIQTKGNIDQINALVSLGSISKQEGERRKLDAALAYNEAQQLNETRRLGITTLTEQERQQSQQRLQQLAAQANAMRDSYDRGVLLDWNAALTAQAEAVAQVSQAATVSGLARLDQLDAEIKKIKEQNEEIGKTKSQVTALKAAREEEAIAMLEIYRLRAYDEGATDESPYIQQLNREIAKLREIQGLLTSGAAAQASDEANKKMQADFKRTADEMNRGLTDALMRGFESGKNFGEAFRDTLVNMFKTTILKPVIQWVLSPVSQAIAGAYTSLGISGAANAATGAGGGSGFGDVLSGISNIGSLFANSSIFSSIATSGLGSALGLSEAVSLMGPTLSGAALEGTAVGLSTLGTAIGTAIPYIGAALLAAKAFGLFDGGGHSTTGTGYQISGQAGSQGLAGTFYGLSASDEASYVDPLSDQAGWTSYFNTQLAGARAEIEKLSRLMGIDSAGLANKSYSVNATGPLDMPQTVGIALQQVTDQMAEQLVPTIRSLQQANESLTQTFIRLANAARAAAIPDALNRMGAALALKDAWKGIEWSDLNPFPMTSAQRLSALAGEYSANLTGARANDLNAYNALAGSAQSYIEQARAEYASSQQYVDIYNAVKSEVGDVVQNTMTEQSNRLADMGLSLQEIVANTNNLDKRIAEALQKAIDAWQAAQLAAQKAAANQVTTAVKQNTAVTARAAVESGLVLSSAESAVWIDAPLDYGGD